MTAGNFVQAQHFDTGFYTALYRDGAYPRTHAVPRERSNAGGHG
jgi:hypothetical protein